MNLDSALGKTGVLAHLTEDEVSFLESAAVDRLFVEGDILFEEDAIAEEFFIIVEGRIGLELVSPRRRPIVIQTLGRGDLVGLSWVFPPYRWSWRARAMDPTKVIAFDARAVRERCVEDRNLSERILQMVAREAVKRLHGARTQMLDLYEFPR